MSKHVCGLDRTECDKCSAELECGQVGLCDDCQTQETRFSLGIDCATATAKKLIRALKRLKSTEHIEGPYPYQEDANLCQVHITTSMDENALDDWLYRVKHGAVYVGVYERGVKA